jgi:uncharacterized protein YndB with AHSA1/START domain
MKQIKKEITINAPAAKVWAHITDPAKIAAWFTTNDFAPKVGHRFKLAGSADCGDIACVVREIDVNRKLAYTFQQAKMNGETLVTFTLEEQGAATKLTLVHSGFEKLTSVAADFPEQYNQGWGTFLGRLQEKAAA